MSDTSALEAQVAALTEMLVEQSRGAALKDVFEEYPEAKAFEDLLVGNTPEEIRETAKVVAERIRSVTQPQTPADEATETPAASTDAPVVETPATPAAPVTGGGSTFVGEAAPQDRVVDAIKRRDFSGWLKAKRETDPSWSGQDEVLSA